MDEEHCVIAGLSEVAKFSTPQINAVTRLFYMSAVPPETTLQKYEYYLN